MGTALVRGDKQFSAVVEGDRPLPTEDVDATEWQPGAQNVTPAGI